ncbi:hypothetical protein HELRODRAFT_188928 [Helobdella robusta]|uniref:Uncharacterized protein n=1 Tax=Helobdella robusta TaxID=6412 RepID=T1FQH5_HELRO|nr:hypothetical protein HELRODRAFT_188928 [Helobdella robusta]ESN98852.1 hypothetical protein HELRODRAFT_188928 [Helobdella robusta]
MVVKKTFNKKFCFSIRKRKLMRSNSSPEKSYFNKMECFKAHEGNKTVVLNSSGNHSDNTDFELYSKTSSACKRHQNMNIKLHPQNKRSQPQQQQQPQQHRQQQQMIRSRSPNYPVNSSAVLIHGYHVGSVDLINSAITSTCAVHHQPTCSTTTADITSHNTFQESSNSGPLAVFYSPYCPRHYFTTAGGAENEIEENVNNCVNQQSSIDQQILQHKDSSLYACIKDGAISTFQTVLPENGNVEASNQLAPGGTKIKFVSTNPPNGNQMELWNKTNFFEKIDDKNSNRAFTSIKCDSPIFKPRQSGNESDNGKRRFSVSCYQEEQNFSDC